MSRTTLGIDATVLAAVERIPRREGCSLGEVVSRLLGEALIAQEEGEAPAAKLEWIAKPMGARVDLEDKGALSAALGESGGA